MEAEGKREESRKARDSNEPQFVTRHATLSLATAGPVFRALREHVLHSILTIRRPGRL